MESNLNTRFKELSGILSGRINAEGFWTGELSSSALGVAVAVAALHFNNNSANSREILKGLQWLKNNVNTDGSFGDTPDSPGNISTTLLVYAAVNLYASEDKSLQKLQKQMAGYLQHNSIDVTSNQVTEIILAHYKKDYTFSVPILTMCALCGIPGKDAFQNIPQLPFELSLLPRSFYKMLNLSVVSYAIPALVAVGIVIFKNKKSNGFARWIRNKSVNKSLSLLQKLMPESGGFLEAIPLTAFVLLSLTGAGYNKLDVVKNGIGFLKRTQREDGGWPIDVDLSTWVTTLSIKALRSKKDSVLSTEQQEKLTRHLLAIQNTEIHPFNGTGQGGWGWTNFSGSVPDCDDTPGVILSLLRLQKPAQVKTEVLAGSNWLHSLQNSDGGFPTFSKGWGKLPFDQSCADLTGHCLLAISATIENYGGEMPPKELKKHSKSIRKAVDYLKRNQNKDGSWIPLWFGNQQTENHSNPVYGTARVVTYLHDTIQHKQIDSNLKTEMTGMVDKGIHFLSNIQNSDGSWGGNKFTTGTIEETALAISALIATNHDTVCQFGFDWLDKYYRKHGLVSAPIGLYFASLWYDEKMYPLVAYLEAVTRMLEKNV